MLSSIFSSIIFSGIGFIVFRRGRTETNNILVVLGILLMAYTYFTGSALADWGIGAALTGASYYFWNS